MTWEIREGHVLDVLRAMPDESVRCVVTSPPYWGLRDYGVPRQVWSDIEHEHAWGSMERGKRGDLRPADTTASTARLAPYISGTDRTGRDEQGRAGALDGGRFCDCGAWFGALGLEPNPAMYVDHLVAVIAEVRRVLSADGTLWLNLGDSYAASRSGPVGGRSTLKGSRHAPHENRKAKEAAGRPNRRWSYEPWGLKPKDLIGIPWRVAFALQADGWWLRSGIVWSKSNPMPESVTDRPTQAHEFMFLLSRSSGYFYDADAIREPDAGQDHRRGLVEPVYGHVPGQGPHIGLRTVAGRNGKGANRRSVWEIPTSPFPEAHFATFPKQLVEPCVLAGSAAGDTVLDPFSGAGTTGIVALQHGRSYIGIELNPEYAEMSRRRIHNDAGLFSVEPERSPA